MKERSGEMDNIWLDLGCGKRKTKGWVGVDIRPFDGVDHVFDVGKDVFPFEDNSVDKIRAVHLFEHLYPEQLFFCVDECFRVLKPEGYLAIDVPKAGTRAYYAHPDHKIQFTQDTFGFFMVPDNRGNVDPHGYLKGFWRLEFMPCENPEVIVVQMHPNKPGGKFPFVEVHQ